MTSAMKARIGATISLALVLGSGASVAQGGGTPRYLGKAATIVGTNANDEIAGTNQLDVIVGRGGDDTIRGQRRRDLLCGGTGNDTIVGSVSRDRLSGGRGADPLHGGSSGDWVRRSRR